MKNKPKLTGKDICLIVAFFVILSIDIVVYYISGKLDSAGVLIERTIMTMLSFVGLVQIASYCNWLILVPDFLIRIQQENEEEKVKSLMANYFDDEINYIHDYSEAKVSYIMTQMGITRDQLEEIRLDIIRMRCMPLMNLNDAKRKIELYVKGDYPFVITQKEKDSSRFCYQKVKYYINFNDPMFLPEYSKEIASLLAFLIREKAALDSVNKLIIPFDSNFLLGVEVGKCLGKPIVKMRQSGKIETEQPWEGNLKPDDKVIIIHDVLVTADQIIQAITKLPSSCSILGVFCLITRKEWNGSERLREKGIKLEQIICLEDNDIALIRGENES